MTSADLERFRRILGMLGSDQVGERSAAALKCSQILRDHGLTWSDVTLPVKQPDVQRVAQPTQRYRDMSPKEFSDMLQQARAAMATDRAARKSRWSRVEPDADGFEPGPTK